MWLLILFFLFCYILFLLVSGSQSTKRRNDGQSYWSDYEPTVSPEIPVDLSDPNTSPETLLEVGYGSQNSEILRLVARNPNTPIKLLLELLAKFPQEVLSNPVLSLLQLENPEFLVPVDYLTILKVLEIPNVPTEFIDSAIYHRSIQVTRRLLEINVLSEKYLENLFSRIQDYGISKIFLHHKHCTDRIKYLILQQGNENLKRALAENCLHDAKNLPVKMIESLAKNSSIDIQMIMVQHPHITDDLLDKLLTPKNKELQYKLATSNSYSYYRKDHISLADRVVLRLAHNQVPNIADRIAIRQELAESDITPAMLTLLSQDPYDKVRCTVAAMADLPPEVLLNLAACRR
jgi:hypothetical protein